GQPGEDLCPRVAELEVRSLYQHGRTLYHELMYNGWPMSEPESLKTQIYMAPREAIRRLVAEGVVQGLTDEKLDELRAECWDGSGGPPGEAGPLGIPSFYLP